MGQKHFSSWYKLICSMILLVVVACAMIVGTVVASSFEGMKTFALFLFGGTFLAMLIGLLHESCAYWILEEDRIIYRKMFGRRRIILRNEIANVRKTGIDMQIFIPCDEYVIEAPAGKIRIVINNENRRLLEEYFGI